MIRSRSARLTLGMSSLSVAFGAMLSLAGPARAYEPVCESPPGWPAPQTTTCNEYGCWPPVSPVEPCTCETELRSCKDEAWRRYDEAIAWCSEGTDATCQTVAQETLWSVDLPACHLQYDVCTSGGSPPYFPPY